MPAQTDGFQGVIRTHYAESTPWWPEDRRAPDDAPNILYILLDDSGFSDVGCYGSLIDTPNIDALAADGLRYNNFHVNAMCSPTRASLLSGCNHHAVGMGHLASFDLGFPSYRGPCRQGARAHQRGARGKRIQHLRAGQMAPVQR